MTICIIGAGSVRLPLMVWSLGQAPGVTEIRLYDIRPERIWALLPVARALGEGGPRLVVCKKPEEALEGADVMVLTARPGFEEGRARDERLCLEEGVIGQETTGPAGFAFAARSIPVAAEYAGLASKWSSRCVILVLMNPAGLVTQALCKLGFQRVFGICDSAMAGVEAIVRAGFAESVHEVEHVVVGLNHLSWTVRAQKGGRDILRDWLNEPRLVQQTMPYFSAELIERKGYIPNEYLTYYYFKEDVLRKMVEAGITRGEEIVRWNKVLLSRLCGYAERGDVETALIEYARYLETRAATYMSYARRAWPAVVRDARDAARKIVAHSGGYAGVACDFLRALCGQKRRLALNVPVGAAAPQWLEQDDVVEISCEVEGEVVRAAQSDWPLDAEDRSLVCRVKEYERLAALAVIERSRALAIHALRAHPLVPSLEVATRLVERFALDF